MIDLNTLFAEFLNKAIAAAVAEQTKELTDKIAELEQQLNDMSEKVDECDVERAVERHFEQVNINEMLDLDSIAEHVFEHRGFDDATRESMHDIIGGNHRY